MVRVKEAIVVEGRYDTIRLCGVVDAVIVQTNGFRLFSSEETIAMLRRLAKERGLIVLTDSDAAGFLIRDRIAAAVPKEQLLHAYIPQRHGKEPRKQEASREGLLGVEGMTDEELLRALRMAGATFEDDGAVCTAPYMTTARLMADGLTGGRDSKQKREALCRLLDLPTYLSTARLMAVLNAAVSEEEYGNALARVDKSEG